ncbi:MAG TPA: hypothetical protein VNW06_07895, partial [Cytophagaceae bacterium]|nr:hypothetical protein [Cytophagaceae bacterium]
CVELLSNLDKYYEQSDTEIKKRIVSSIFPFKLIFDTKKVRTLNLPLPLDLISSNSKGYRGSKKRKHTAFGMLSHRVELQGFEPWSRQDK